MRASDLKIPEAQDVLCLRDTLLLTTVAASPRVALDLEHHVACHGVRPALSSCFPELPPPSALGTPPVCKQLLFTVQGPAPPGRVVKVFPQTAVVASLCLPACPHPPQFLAEILTNFLALRPQL